MKPFEQQIIERQDNDRLAFEESFREMTGAVMGKGVSRALSEDRYSTDDAIGQVLKFYHVQPKDMPQLPEDDLDINEILEYRMRPYGIMRRTVTLKEQWYRDAAGAMIGVRKDDESVVALIPNTFGNGYHYYDRNTGNRVILNRKTAENIDSEAIAFYKPFPLTKLSIGDLMKYIIQMISFGDIVMLELAMLAVVGVGLLVPWLNNKLFSDVLESGSLRLLVGIGIFMICVAISNTLFTTIKTLMSARISTRLSFAVESATMMRILSLPSSFFRKYSAGELHSRSTQLSGLCNAIVEAVFNTGLSALFSLIYLTQISVYAPSLVVPSLIATFATIAVSLIQTFVQMGVTRKSKLASSKESGITYQLISGIQKIKLAGAEKRAFSRWATAFSKSIQYVYSPPFFLKIAPVITMGISLIATIIMYGVAIKGGVSIAEYYAFNSAYGMVNSAFFALAAIVTGIAGIKPTLEMAQPIMEYEPEVALDREVITELEGKIELNNITFNYEGSEETIIDDLSLSIDPGEYVAIVGKTGCGKSTLVRIMLGFEVPKKGTVYFDNKDIRKLDLRSLRRRIGTVMQNGKLFNGDIYSNITISAPWLTLDDAWEAAEISRIADDIREMPMEMRTVISEGQGGISGGQRQRLLIARAIAPKPNVLIFDEATSALDNITQKAISAALNDMKCTRIVIAHRLSTIKRCDRIIMIDKGKIVEEGTYEQLQSRNGLFAEMVARQQVE